MTSKSALALGVAPGYTDSLTLSQNVNITIKLAYFVQRPVTWASNSGMELTLDAAFT